MLYALTFGEAMAMFVADTTGTLADIEHFQRRLAGADNNVAIGLARLGFHVSWLSRVGNDGFGQFIRQALEAEGIDGRHIHTDSQHPTGLLFKERASGGADSISGGADGGSGGTAAPDEEPTVSAGEPTGPAGTSRQRR